MITKTTNKMYKNMIFKIDVESDNLVTKFLNKNVEVIIYPGFDKFCIMKYKDLYLKVWVNTESDSNYRTNFSSIFFIEDIRKNKNANIFNVLATYESNEYANLLYKKNNINLSLENINKIETICKNNIIKDYKPDYLNLLLES